MRVSGTSSKSSSAPTSGAPAPSNPLARDVAPPERPAVEASDYLPSGEVASYTALAAQEPEQRPGSLQEAAARLSTGYYLTPESATRTAEAIINALD